MKTTKAFKEAIKSYLDNRAKNDELFAATYAKEGKNIDDCCTYILNTVQKSGSNGFADSEIYSMAVHYYDEDKIDIGGDISCHVVVNHVVELTEEEKKEERQKAIKKYHDEVIASMKKSPAKPKKKEAEFVQPSLFD